MFVLSKKNYESVAVGGEDGAHRLREVSLLEAHGERGFDGDAEVPVQQLEMLERIRVAAGQTS